jgi:small subunit ribosomal protein S8
MDPVANMLTKIKNAQAVAHETVDIPFSNLKFNLAKLLEKEGLVESVETQGRKVKKVIRIKLKYKGHKDPAISELKKISKPGKRVYVKKENLKKLAYKKGFAILSTPEGLMTSREALKKGIGGEYLCEIV